MFGDKLENTRVEDLLITPGLATLDSVPSNQQILDAVKRFYSAQQALVDTTATNVKDVSQNDKAYVAKINTNTDDFQHSILTQQAKDQTSTGIFGKDKSGKCDSGIFGPTLCKTKSSNLFSTIGIGLSAEAVLLVGGYGGLGCAWDITGRETPRGYRYSTLELGIKVEADLNIQAAIFSKIPSNLNSKIYGINVGAAYIGGLGLSVFFTGDNLNDPFGYSVSAGVGLGGGAAIFGGSISNF